MVEGSGVGGYTCGFFKKIFDFPFFYSFNLGWGVTPSLPEWLYLSLSLLASSPEHCIRVSCLCNLYLSCTLLGPYSLGMAMFVLHFLYLIGPYPWDVGNV